MLPPTQARICERTVIVVAVTLLLALAAVTPIYIIIKSSNTNGLPPASSSGTDVTPSSLRSPSTSYNPVVSEHGAVTAFSHTCRSPEHNIRFYNTWFIYLCSDIGLDVLKRGGNAVDAAVATALCLDVEQSFGTTIGGGGGMLYIHLIL